MALEDEAGELLVQMHLGSQAAVSVVLFGEVLAFVLVLVLAANPVYRAGFVDLVRQLRRRD